MSLALSLTVWIIRSQAQCDSVIFPSVGNIPQCLEGTLDSCATNSDYLLDGLVSFFKCVFDELPRIADPVAALYNLVDFYGVVLTTLELPVNVSSVSRLLCYRLNFSLEACLQPVPQKGSPCGPPVSLFFPSSFGMRQTA
ncbi:uncharacterized protein LOC144139729 [Haemaphysalis longicornis]